MGRRSTLELMESRSYRAWLLTLLLLLSTFAFVDRQIISALAQPIKNELKISDTQVGLLGGIAFAVLNSVLSIPLARLAERHSRKVIYGIGVLLWSVATISCGLAGSFAGLLLARVAVGIGEASQSASTSLTYDYYPPHRRVATSSVLVLAIPLGALLGSAGGGLIAQLTGWRWAFVSAGAPGLLLGTLLLLTIREPLRGHYDPPSPYADAVPPFSAVIRRMRERRSFLHVLLGSTLISAGGFGINIFVAAYLVRRFGLDFAESGLISGMVSAFAGATSMVIGGMLANRLGQRDKRYYAWLPAIGGLLTCPLFVVTFVQSGWISTTFMLVITGLFQYFYLPASGGIYANTMEPRMRATSGALVNIFTNVIGAGLGPLISGMVSDHMAARNFGEDYGRVCAGINLMADASCRAASATGLRWALILMALFYLWGAIHFLWAARTINHDMS